MKRLLALCMMLLFLVGCAQTEPPVVEPESSSQAEEPAPEETAAPETEEILEPEPKPEVAPEPVPVPEPAPALEPEPVEPVISVPEPEVPTEPEPVPTEPAPEPEAPDWMEQAVQTFKEIVDEKIFTVQVAEPDGTVTELLIEPGKNDWNVASREYALRNYLWTEATAEEWQAVETPGNSLRMAAGDVSLSCYENSDVVEFVTAKGPVYFRAVNPKEGELFEYKLYGALEVVAEDAMSSKVWAVAASGSLEPDEAAAILTEAIVENYSSVPEWVIWKPLEVKPGKAEVFDVYRGQEAQFCFNFGIRVALEDHMSAGAGYWQAGSGMEEPDEDGFCGWGREVLVKKNAAGDWQPTDWGTGGYSVQPPYREELTRLQNLVEQFCLTEGWSHEWLVPYNILDLKAEELVSLASLLDQLTEEEGRDLCATLGALLKEYDDWEWTTESLGAMLGEYSSWLDA